MSTSESTYIPGLTSVRGIAALSIVFFHAYAIAVYPGQGTRVDADLLGAGYLAVDVFYVLSGLVLFLPIVRRGGSPGAYGAFMVRRVTRLWPAYAIVLMAGLLLHNQLGVSSGTLPPEHGGWAPIVSHLLLLPTFTGLQQLGFGFEPVIWSLSVEMCFSLLLPLIARVWFRHPFRCFAVSVIFSRGWVFGVTHAGPGAANLLHPGLNSANYFGGADLLLELPTYAAHFGLGMTLAWIFVRHGVTLRSRLAGWEAVLVVLGLVGVLAVATVLGRNNARAPGGYDQWTKTWPLLVPLSVLLVGVILGGGRLAVILNSRLLHFLGDISYPLYLIHFVVMQAATTADAQVGWSGFEANVATVPVSILLAWLLHRWVEVPAAEWGRRHAPPVAPRATPERPASCFGRRRAGAAGDQL